VDARDCLADLGERVAGHLVDLRARRGEVALARQPEALAQNPHAEHFSIERAARLGGLECDFDQRAPEPIGSITVFRRQDELCAVKRLGARERRNRLEIELEDLEAADDAPDQIVIVGYAGDDQMGPEAGHELAHFGARDPFGRQPAEEGRARVHRTCPSEHILIGTRNLVAGALGDDRQLVAIVIELGACRRLVICSQTS
jgi:hypothetical protein